MEMRSGGLRTINALFRRRGNLTDLQYSSFMQARVVQLIEAVAAGNANNDQSEGGSVVVRGRQRTL
jgi:hypothetical protein